MFIGVILALQVLVRCASLDARSHQNTLATVSEPTTAVVIRTFGDINEQQALIHLYAAQLQGSAFQLSVLHDAGNPAVDSQEQVMVDSSGGFKASKRKTRVVKRRGFVFTVSHYLSTSKEIAAEVPVCMVSWAKAEGDYDSSTMDDISELGVHSAHDQFLSLWYRHCNPLHASFAWFLEDDVRFSGQVTKFFRSYGNEDADLVSSGFRLAGPDWWKYRTIKESSSEWTLSHMTNFSQSAKVVKNLETLPYLQDAYGCFNVPQTQRTMQQGYGVVFFQDHVLRASSRLLEALDKCFADGIAGPSESFIARICGSQLHFSDHSPCTILDFAPVARRNSSDQWVSSQFWCWNTKFESSGKENTCSPVNKNKWFHKCESTPEDFNCQD